MQRTRGDGVIGNSPKEKEEDKENLPMLIYTKGKYSIKKLNQQKNGCLSSKRSAACVRALHRGGKKKKKVLSGGPAAFWSHGRAKWESSAMFAAPSTLSLWTRT